MLRSALSKCMLYETYCTDPKHFWAVLFPVHSKRIRFYTAVLVDHLAPQSQIINQTIKNLNLKGDTELRTLVARRKSSNQV